MTVSKLQLPAKDNAVQLKINEIIDNLGGGGAEYSAGTGLSLSGTTFNHSNSVTAGTIGTSSATSGSTISVPYATYDAQGHITGKGTHTHTVTGFLTSSSTQVASSRFDGQWVHSQHLAGSSTAKGAYTANLSSYLPSDSYNYEVMVNLRAYSSNSSNTGSVYVYSDIWSKTSGGDYATQGAAGGYSRQISNTFIIPVGTERKIYYSVEQYAISTLSLILWGYRRIGTNQ